MPVFCLLLAFCAGFHPLPLQAKLLPKWELGLSYLDVHVPHYPGSNEYYGKNLVLPFGIYRTDSASFSGGVNLYGKLWGVDFSLSGGLKLPVGSSDFDDPTPDGFEDENAEIFRDRSYRRRGMDSLPLLFGVGAQASKKFWNRFEFRVRVLNFFAFEGEGNRGYVVRPSLAFNFFDEESIWVARVRYGLDYGNKSINELYFSVSPEDALPERPAFEADAGLIETESSLVLGVRYERFRFFTFYSLADMSGSAFAESPLIARKKYRRYGFGIFYSFFRSEKRVFREGDQQ